MLFWFCKPQRRLKIAKPIRLRQQHSVQLRFLFKQHLGNIWEWTIEFKTLGSRRKARRRTGYLGNTRSDGAMMTGCSGMFALFAHRNKFLSLSRIIWLNQLTQQHTHWSQNAKRSPSTFTTHLPIHCVGVGNKRGFALDVLRSGRGEAIETEAIASPRTDEKGVWSWKGNLQHDFVKAYNFKTKTIDSTAEETRHQQSEF